MVTVVNYLTKQAKDGREFVLLQLQGGVEMVQSQQTGKFYATVRKCTVSTTFDEATAKSLIGTQLPGKIVRIDCEPYEYVEESTGQVLSLAHRWTFWPEGADAPMPEAVS